MIRGERGCPHRLTLPVLSVLRKGLMVSLR